MQDDKSPSNDNITDNLSSLNKSQLLSLHYQKRNRLLSSFQTETLGIDFINSLIKDIEAIENEIRRRSTDKSCS